MVLNATGAVAEREEVIPQLLAGQLVNTIRWTDVMSTFRDLGVLDFVTIGPGAVLRSLVRKNLGTEMRVHGTEDARDIRRTVSALQRHLS